MDTSIKFGVQNPGIAAITRRVIHIAAGDGSIAVAICDDGTLWRLAYIDADGPPKWVQLPPIPEN